MRHSLQEMKFRIFTFSIRGQMTIHIRFFHHITNSSSPSTSGPVFVVIIYSEPTYFQTGLQGGIPKISWQTRGLISWLTCHWSFFENCTSCMMAFPHILVSSPAGTWIETGKLCISRTMLLWTYLLCTYEELIPGVMSWFLNILYGPSHKLMYICTTVRRALGNPWRRWVDLRVIGIEGVDWIDLIQNRDKWRALMNTVMNPLVPWCCGKCFSDFTSSGISRRKEVC
jgi:hypothetical protein